MAKAAKKIVFSRSRDIPFSKLVLSTSNVRRIRPDQNIDELAEDIARREDLVQGLNVRPVLDADGNETGMFEVPAGGRRYRAIERLVKAKRSRTVSFPASCAIRPRRSSRRTTRLRKTSIASLFIRSISSEPSWTCVKNA